MTSKATSSFCAAYQAAYKEMHSGSPGEAPRREGLADLGTGMSRTGPSWDSVPGKTDISGWACVVTGLFLLWAAARGGSYNFFILLRIIVTGTSLAVIIKAFKNPLKSWIFFLGTALLFNPVLPIYLTRGIWIVIDLTAVLAFLAFGIYSLKSRGPGAKPVRRPPGLK